MFPQKTKINIKKNENNSHSKESKSSNPLQSYLQLAIKIVNRKIQETTQIEEQNILNPS